MNIFVLNEWMRFIGMEDWYLYRIMDDIIKEELNLIGAIVIIGQKWCGKTTTAQQHSISVLKLQDLDTFESYKELA